MNFLRQMFGSKDKAATGNGGALLRLRSQLVGSPLAMDPAKVEVFLASLADAGMPAKAEAADSGEPARVVSSVDVPTVAVVPVRGVLIHRSMGEPFDSWFGVVGYDSLRARIQAALADEAVREIVLDIDSPGGMVAGVHALADFIAESRSVKPITALVNETAVSAAYLIASAATRVVGPGSSYTGSIGVIWTHVDWSSWNERAGLRVTHIHAGARKADFSPDLPLSPDALAEHQARIDAHYEMFVDAVARYRSVDAQAIRDTEARILLAAEAKTLGLLDEVVTPDAALAAALARASSAADEPDEALVDDPPEEEPELDDEPVEDDEPADDDAPDGDEEEEEEDEPEAKRRSKSTRSQVAAAIADERKRVTEIAAICETFGVPDLAQQLVASGASLEETRVRASTLAALHDPTTMPGVDPMADAGPGAAAQLAAAMKRLNARKR